MASIENPIASGSGPRPEFDELIPGGTGVISAINRYRIEADDARRQRIAQGRRNWQTYLGQQDFSGKLEGQSTEFLPKVPVSVEQLAALIKRGMVQFGDYFSCEIDEEQLGGIISGDQVRTIIKGFLSDLWGPNNNTTNFPTIVSDGTKHALLKSLIILKVHGGYMKERTFEYQPPRMGMNDLEAEPAALKTNEKDQWHLRIDLVRAEDYYPDPTGMGLYEIHRTENDLHNIIAMADEEIYDRAAVNQLIGRSQERPEDEKLPERDRNQGETTHPSFRKKVVLDEFWGTLLDDDGKIAHRNCVAVVANEKYLIRPPEPNPFWHQRSPFVVAPLVRVPFSVWHKAIYDHASDLNLAINEMFNLMLDGGIAAVHGVKQIRMEDLEDPSQVEGGIKQGQTLAVKNTLPHNAKVLETVTEGDVPQDAMAVFEFLNREFTQAAMTNELKLGSLPPKQVLATEVLESSQSQNLMLDGIVADLENNCLAPALTLAWMNILQMADQIPDTAFKTVIDRKIALQIMRAKPEERFALFAGRAQFKVNGLSATMTRALDFQKLMSLMQAVGTSPVLLQQFMLEYSPGKIIKQMFTTLNINPDTIRKSAEELSKAQEELSRTAGAAGLIANGPQNSEGEPSKGLSGPGTGGNPMAAAVNQGAKPATGMPGNA